MRLPFVPLFAGVALFAAGIGPVVAQDASPVASPVAGQAPIELLFVQGFASATLGETDADGTFALTLTGVPAQVAYFADRPNREVGIVPVGEWVEVLGAMGDDPPNAALVAETEDGGAELAVLELLGVEGAEADGELTYRVRPLEDLAELDPALAARPMTELEAGKAFGSGHLFIDDVIDDLNNRVNNSLNTMCYFNVLGTMEQMPCV